MRPLSVKGDSTKDKKLIVISNNQLRLTGTGQPRQQSRDFNFIYFKYFYTFLIFGGVKVLTFAKKF